MMRSSGGSTPSPYENARHVKPVGQILCKKLDIHKYRQHDVHRQHHGNANGKLGMLGLVAEHLHTEKAAYAAADGANA